LVMAEEFDSDELLEHIFERVAAEVSAGHYKPGLQAMTAAQTEGDEAKAKALYLQLRAKQIAKEMAAEAADTVRQAMKEERKAADAKRNIATEELMNQFRHLCLLLLLAGLMVFSLLLSFNLL
jgi:hypothetical protein